MVKLRERSLRTPKSWTWCFLHLQEVWCSESGRHVPRPSPFSTSSTQVLIWSSSRCCSEETRRSGASAGGDGSRPKVERLAASTSFRRPGGGYGPVGVRRRHRWRLAAGDSSCWRGSLPPRRDNPHLSFFRDSVVVLLSTWGGGVEERCAARCHPLGCLPGHGLIRTRPHVAAGAPRCQRRASSMRCGGSCTLGHGGPSTKPSPLLHRSVPSPPPLPSTPNSTAHDAHHCQRPR